MAYKTENQAKANFDNVYIQPTPHAYVKKMALHGYQIGEQARPYCLACARLLEERNGAAWPVQMLDVGCSYGMGSAFVKYGCSFDEIVAFFYSRAPKDLTSCSEVTRMWLNVTAPACDMRCVGLDSSSPAIRFGLNSGLLDAGIVCNLEETATRPTPEDIEWFKSCNLLISTGAIGYITEETLSKVLPHLGKDHPADFGPIAVLTILRMFETEPIFAAFKKAGLILKQVPDIRLLQRNFADETEKTEVRKLLRDKGLDTRDYEDHGTLFADLYVAASTPKQLTTLIHRMQKVQSRLSTTNIVSFIRRNDKVAKHDHLQGCVEVV